MVILSLRIDQKPRRLGELATEQNLHRAQSTTSSNLMIHRVRAMASPVRLAPTNDPWSGCADEDMATHEAAGGDPNLGWVDGMQPAGRCARIKWNRDQSPAPFRACVR